MPRPEPIKTNEGVGAAERPTCWSQAGKLPWTAKRAQRQPMHAPCRHSQPSIRALAGAFQVAAHSAKVFEQLCMNNASAERSKGSADGVAFKRRQRVWRESAPGRYASHVCSSQRNPTAGPPPLSRPVSAQLRAAQPASFLLPACLLMHPSVLLTGHPSGSGERRGGLQPWRRICASDMAGERNATRAARLGCTTCVAAAAAQARQRKQMVGRVAEAARPSRDLD